MHDSSERGDVQMVILEDGECHLRDVPFLVGHRPPPDESCSECGSNTVLQSSTTSSDTHDSRISTCVHPALGVAQRHDQRLWPNSAACTEQEPPVVQCCSIAQLLADEARGANLLMERLEDEEIDDLKWDEGSALDEFNADDELA